MNKTPKEKYDTAYSVAWAEYEEAVAPSRKKYVEVRRDAFEVFENKISLAWLKYKKILRRRKKGGGLCKHQWVHPDNELMQDIRTYCVTCGKIRNGGGR